MSLREEIEKVMPEFVTLVNIKDKNVHGLESTNVVVLYTIHGKNMFLDLNFAKQNKMTHEHIAAVVRSYLPDLEISSWENEGGSH